MKQKTNTIFLRREPSIDKAAPPYGKRRAFDVVAYEGPMNTVPLARWMWNNLDKPRPGCKSAMLNCYRRWAEWLPDVVALANELTPREMEEQEAEAIRLLRPEGWQVLNYHHRRYQTVVHKDGTRYAMPRDLLGPEVDGKRQWIVWREKGDEQNMYDFAGWSPHWGYSVGGFSRTLYGALSWFTWAEQNK